MREIFKYLKWDRGKETLQSNMLYLPSPEEFDDKYDCSFKGFSSVDQSTIVERLRGLLTNEKYRIIAIAKGVFCGTPSEWEETINQILDGNNKNNPALYETVWNLIPLLISTIKNIDPSDYEWSARKQLKVLCLCLEFNNVFLWENYADNNTGLAIGLNYDILKEMPGTAILNVNYSEDIPSYGFGKYTEDISRKKLGTKLMKFKSEHETRVVFHTDYRRWLNISNLTTSVTFGNRACFTNRLIDELRTKYTHVQLYKMDSKNKNREPVTASCQ